jgi:ankyrin repeat protein
MDLLVGAGEDINSPPAAFYGKTPLQEAVEHHSESIELVEWLLDRGANVNAPPALEHGETALQGAARVGNLKLALLLMDRGADVNAKPSPCNGRYAVEAAAEYGRLDMVQLLLKAGAVGNPADERGPLARAIELAESGNHFGVANVLRSAEKKLIWEKLTQF